MKQKNIIKRVSIKIDIKSWICAVAMTACIVSTAQGAAMVEPEKNVLLQGDVLTVGDIFKKATTHANFVLAPAPAAGESLTLYAHDLQRVSNRFGLGWLASTSPVTQTTVRRDTYLMNPSKIESAVHKELASMSHGGQKFEIQLNSASLNVYVPTEYQSSLTVSDVKADLANGSFSAKVSAQSDQSKARGFHQDIAGRFFNMTEVPVLVTAMRQGDIISKTDIDYIDVRSDTLSQNVIVSEQSMIGQTPRRGVAAMKPLTESDLMMPRVIKKGEKITMNLRHLAIQLTAQGRALEDGAVGDIVRVMNVSSQQVVQGVVTGPRTIEIDAPMANKI